EVAAGHEGVEEGVHAALEVLRMHAFGPADADFFLHVPAGEAHPAFVEEVAFGVGAGHPEQYRGVVRHRAEPQFALEQIRPLRYRICIALASGARASVTRGCHRSCHSEITAELSGVS